MIYSVNSIQDISLDVIKQSIRDLRDQEQQMEAEERLMLLDFYDNLQNKDAYLKKYGFETVEIPLQTINLTKKIIDKISLVYKQQPDRRFESEQETDKDSFTDWLTYDISTMRFVPWTKEAERKKNLLGVVLKRPMYLKDRGWRFYVDTQFIPHFIEGDPFTPVAYSIPIKHDVISTDKGNVEEDWFMYWSDTHYFWYQKDSEKMMVPEADKFFVNDAYEHKLEMMPIVESRTNFPTENYWVSGATDLVQSNQSINVNLNNLNVALHYQAFDQMYGTGILQEEADNIKVGANKVIALSHTDMELGLLGYSPKIVDMIQAIKFDIAAIGAMYNVNIDAVLEQSGDASSGFALLVKNIDLMEAREDDVELAEMEEQQVAKVIQRQQEVYKIPKEPRFPKDKKLIVDFREIEFPINQAEEQTKLEFEYKHNISTPVHTLASKEGLTLDEAKERYAENKAINKELTPVEEAFNQTLNELQNDTEGTE